MAAPAPKANPKAKATGKAKSKTPRNKQAGAAHIADQDDNYNLLDLIGLAATPMSDTSPTGEGEGFALTNQHIFH